MATRAPAATMTAAVLAAPAAIRIDQVAVAEPRAGEVLVRVDGCGVCASSLPLWEGRPWFEYPLAAGAPGHEAWGTLADGTRVAVLTQHGYAEWAAVPERLVVEIPSELDDLPFPGEALGCAALIFRCARVCAGERVAIVGAGFLGSALAQLACAAGAEVVVVRRNTPVGSLAESCDCAIETGGVQETLDVAARVVRTGGRLVVAGYHQDGLRQLDLGSLNWRAVEIVNAHERDELVVLEAIREAAELAAHGILDLEQLVTHRLPLRRLADAFELARTRPAGFIKAVVEP